MSVGLPYMGSKRKLSGRILDHILEHNPNCEYFYDLFGGGGSISFEALRRNRFKKVLYNELNTGVVSLLKKIRDDGITKEFYQWVDKDTFNKHKFDDDWFGGLVKVCWSFGNKGVTYLYGRGVEDYKKNFHLVVVDGLDKLDEMMEFCERCVFEKYGIKQDCNLVMPQSVSFYDRRLEIRHQLIAFERLCKSNQIKGLENLKQLQNLKQLEHLERLQNLDKPTITNLSYEQVEIDTPIEKTIIYCDIPYIGTAEYQCGGFNHEGFYDWVKKSDYRIYVSSYESNLFEVESYRHLSTLSATNNQKVTEEKLFCNQIYKKSVDLFG